MANWPDAQALIHRHAEVEVIDSLAYNPVVFLLGARQVGKSTLALEIARQTSMENAISLDTQTARDAARTDPAGFLANLEGRVFIDEIQRAPDLLLAIKESIDRDRAPGRFLLTGSANVLTAPQVHDALTGRAGYVRLAPLAQSEIEQADGNIIERLLRGDVPRIRDAPVGRAAFASRVAEGGYPVARGLSSRRRQRWFADYLESTIVRDLREIADARKLGQMPRLLHVIAAQVGGVHVTRNLARSLDMTHDTVRSYTQLLETVFLVRQVPAWRPGIAQREVHAPKVFVTDSGLLAALLGTDEDRIGIDDRFTGGLLENFVAMEVARHVDLAEASVRQYHYRDRRGEIDVVLESNTGDLVAIEVKARATIGPRDWRAIARLRDARPSEFRAGVVLHAGPQTMGLSDRIWALPLAALWV